ncbi:hypothetical protein [Psychrobacter sp. DAB_AL62B]|uniref:hypothetical protein n=1 Tax=Psychrobacter sp. DAB_AL62B TaxID=1028420 RepID=UPI0023813AA8|nr:hypothetical protein [Psychrobacter sp. DAB_AL62B]MDE4455274.1 hypothetical protein [Psychrobacter sp. DAB_AL62B]
MNYLMKITAICLLTTLSIASYAQSINVAINKEVAKNIKLLNIDEKKEARKNGYEDEAMNFVFDRKEVVMKDLNFDGIQDAIALIYYCEETSCHATTKSVNLVVFKGLGKNQFTKLGSAFLGLNAKIKNINKGVINVISYDYGDEDPECCPSKQSLKSYKITNGKLVKAK